LPEIIQLEDIIFNENDICVVGSDQVWNTDITGEKATDYFLNFLPDKIKRIAYAASFGNTAWDNKKIENDVDSCLKKFSAISVREKTGISICSDVFKVSSQLALDPTLLLDNYDEFIANDEKNEGKLVSFLFAKKKNSGVHDLIRFISKKINKRPLMMAERRFHRGISNIPWVTVEQWVSYVANSSFVITDSFHCTVFAILHKKQFIVIPANIKRVGRILHLLESLGLTGRYYPDVQSVYEADAWLKPIDYQEVSKKLLDLRNDSMEFLKNSLGA
jgi:hypothetical protein